MNELPTLSPVMLSVGGSPELVLHVLSMRRPPGVWYFCSARGRANADAIRAALDWHRQAP